MEKKYNDHANKGGVYKITNTKNGKVYIGSAKNFKKRAYQHVSSLRSNRHQNKHLQTSWNKWGEDVFLFEVIEVVDGSKETRFEVEQKHINRLIKEGKWEEGTFNFKKKTVQKERSCFSNTPEKTKKKKSDSTKQYWQLLSDEKRNNIEKLETKP